MNISERNVVKPKILITGGMGFIGSHTSTELIKEYDIVIVDNLFNSDSSVIDRIKYITKCDNIVFHNVDLLDKKETEKIFNLHHPEIVIHFAGLKSVGESIKNPLSYYQNNLIMTFNLLELMDKYQCYNLIFSSSATVYGRLSSPFSETLNIGIGITHPYGQTKFMIEQILKDICFSNKKWHIVSLRYFNPIGAHPSGLIGEKSNGIPNNLMPYLLKVAVNNNTAYSFGNEYNELSVFGNDYDTKDGFCIRDYIHVMDIARGHLCVLNKINNLCGYNVYNLGTGQGTSVIEIIKIFEKVNNVKIPLKITSRRDGDVPVIYCDANKAKNELGWVALLSIRDMCYDSWNFQINQL